MISREVRGPRLALVGVLLTVGVVETAFGMAKRNPGASFAYQLGHAVGGAIPQVLFNAVLALVVGLVVYALRRFRASGVQVLEAIFSWPVVVVTAAFALLQYI